MSGLDKHFEKKDVIKLSQARKHAGKPAAPARTKEQIIKEAKRKANAAGMGAEAKELLKAVQQSATTSPGKGKKSNQSNNKNKRNKKNKSNKGIQQSTNFKPINDAQTQLKGKPRTSQGVKKYQADLFTLLSKNKLSGSNSITDNMMSKLTGTLKGVSQYMHNVLRLDNIQLSESDRTSILNDLAVIDGAIETGMSAEMLKATDIIFRTIRKYLAVDALPEVEANLFSNINDIIAWAELMNDPSNLTRQGGPDDPRVEPDITMYQPFALIPITEVFKQKLKDMGATVALVDELGNYAPGYNDDAASDKKGLSKATTEYSFGSNLPNDYLGPKDYDQIIENAITFIREVNETLISRKLTHEYYTDSNKTTTVPTIDIAIKHYFYLVMNTAWKLIIEQTLDIDDIVTGKLGLELSRFNPVQPNDLVNIFMLSNRHILSDDQERIANILKRIDIAYEKNLYNMFKPVFREHTYTYKSDVSGYYLGGNRVGDHIYNVRVIPQMILPCPLTGLTLAGDGLSVTGKNLYTDVYVEDGLFDERTRVLKDLQVPFSNLLVLHTKHISTVAGFNALVSDSRWNIDKELYFSTRAAAYGAFSDTIDGTLLGNLGVQVAKQPTALSNLYPDGDLGDSSSYATKAIAHLSDHCSQYSIGLFKTAAKFIPFKFQGYKYYKLFLNHIIGMGSHPNIGYTESLSPRVSTRNVMTKMIEPKNAFSLVQLISGSTYTYLHRDTVAFPMYIAKDAAGKYDIRVVNVNGQKTVTKASVEKVLTKKGKDHYFSPKDTDLRLAVDANSGLLGYQDQAGGIKDVLYSNDNIMELQKFRTHLIPGGMAFTHYVTSDHPVKGAAITIDNSVFGDALVALMTHFKDEDLFADDYVLTEVVTHIFRNGTKQLSLVPVATDATLSGLALLNTDEKKVQKDVTDNFMKLFGLKVMPQLVNTTPSVFEVGRTGLIGKVNNDALLVKETDIYPKTVKIDTL